MDQFKRKIRIAEFGRIVTGKTPPTIQPELYGAIYPFVTPTDMTDDSRIVKTARYISEQGREKHSSAMLPPKAVCFTCIASIGKMCMTSQISLTNQQINSIVVDPQKHDPLYVFYLLHGESERIKALASGVATPIINKTSFSEIEVEVFQVATQKKIAAILSSYDDLIENNLRRIKILEEMAQNLYSEWFGKFRFPGHEHARFVDSSLGRIPEGWQTTTIGKESSYINRGITPNYDNNSTSLVINQKCIRDHTLDIRKSRKHRSKVNPEKYIHFGDILINSTGVGTLGRVAQVYSSPTDVTVVFTRVASSGRALATQC